MWVELMILTGNWRLLVKPIIYGVGIAIGIALISIFAVQPHETPRRAIYSGPTEYRP